MSEAHLLPGQGNSAALVEQVQFAPACLECGEVQRLSKQQEVLLLAAMQEKAVGSAHAFWEVYREAVAAFLWHRREFQKPLFAAVPSWEVRLILSLWSSCVP